MTLFWFLTQHLPRPTRRAAGAVLLLAMAVSAGCRDEGAAPGGASRAAPAARAGGPGGAAVDPAGAALDPRSQYELSAALTQVESSRDRDAVATGYARLRSDWMGKRYRWRMQVIEPLCRSRDACNLLPFEPTDRAKGIVHGWMPHLVLDDGAFAAIQRACAGKPRCDVEVEGTLSRLVADTENPTSVEFSQVRIL